MQQNFSPGKPTRRGLAKANPTRAGLKPALLKIRWFTQGWPAMSEHAQGGGGEGVNALKNDTPIKFAMRPSKNQGVLSTLLCNCDRGHFLDPNFTMYHAKHKRLPMLAFDQCFPPKQQFL